MGITCSSNSNHKYGKTMQTKKQRCIGVDSNLHAFERCAVCYEQSIRIEEIQILCKDLPQDVIKMIMKYCKIKHYSFFLGNAIFSFKQHTFSLSKPYDREDYYCRSICYSRRIKSDCEVFNNDMNHGARNKTYQFTFEVREYTDAIGISTSEQKYFFYHLQKGPTLYHRDWRDVERRGESHSFTDKRARALYHGAKLTVEIRYDNEQQVWLRFKRFDRWYSAGNIGLQKDIRIEVRHQYTNVFKSIEFIGYKAF